MRWKKCNLLIGTILGIVHIERKRTSKRHHTWYKISRVCLFTENVGGALEPTHNAVSHPPPPQQKQVNKRCEQTIRIFTLPESERDNELVDKGIFMKEMTTNVKKIFAADVSLVERKSEFSECELTLTYESCSIQTKHIELRGRYD